MSNFIDKTLDIAKSLGRFNRDRTYTIKELTELTGFHKNSILNYNKKGIITLFTYQGKLVCSDCDKNKLIYAKTLSNDYGINIAGIKYLLAVFRRYAKDEIKFLEVIKYYGKISNMTKDYINNRQSIYQNKYKRG